MQRPPVDRTRPTQIICDMPTFISHATPLSEKRWRIFPLQVDLERECFGTSSCRRPVGFSIFTIPGYSYCCGLMLRLMETQFSPLFVRMPVPFQCFNMFRVRGTYFFLWCGPEDAFTASSLAGAVITCDTVSSTARQRLLPREPR